METKQCTKCQETKTLDQFYKLNENNAKKQSQKDGHDYYCKYCRCGASIKSHHKTNKPKCTVSECETGHYSKGLCRKHYERFRKNGTTESLKDVVEISKTYEYTWGKVTNTRDSTLKYMYKISLEEFLEMSKDGCQICGYKPERNLQMDHDHSCCPAGSPTCGKCVRGVVCNKCNQNVGRFEAGRMRDDNPSKDKIKEYLHG